MSVSIYTIGYGNRRISEFLSLLREHSISYLIDVRSSPYSRMKPEFSREALTERLAGEGVRYVFMGDVLGGRPDDPGCYDAEGRVDYARCRERPWFIEGIERLRTAWEKGLRVALMCSEARPEDCHRTKLVAQGLADARIEVAHIDENGRIITHHEALERLLGGAQIALFEVADLRLTSRKRYRAPRKGPGRND